MKSKLKSECKHCSNEINVGDEIVRAGNGVWMHDECASNVETYMKNQDAPEVEESNEILFESKIKMNTLFKCVNCQGDCFLESMKETSVLDEGRALTKKLYICQKCSYIMQFVEKIV